jgi:heme exporter protein C
MALLALGVAAGIVLSFAAPDAKSFQNPGLARIVFFHLPCALTATLFTILASYFALRHLLSKRLEWDVRSESAFELGAVLGLLTLVTGILFSKVQWGAWWNWDPRQTSFLLVMLLVGAYFTLRGGFADEARRAAAAGAYAVAAALPILFLIFVYPRLPSVVSLHPDVVGKGGFDAAYRTVFLFNFVMVLAAAVWIYRLRVRAGLLEIRLGGIDEGLDDRGDSAASGVVRPVSLPPES